MKRIKFFENVKRRIKKEKEATEEAIELKQKNIQTESGNIEQLKKLDNRFGFILQASSDIPEEKLSDMPEEQFRRFANPLESLSVSGASVLIIRDESRETLNETQRQEVILASTGTATSTAVPAFQKLFSQYPDYFPHRETISKKYKGEDELKNDINYIRTQLPQIRPDISKDFGYFVAKFYAFKADESKYQDLVGIRSMLFFRLIFDFCDKNYGFQKPRKESIKKFVFGKGAYDRAAGPIIDNAYNLYIELSKQTGQSVKIGNVSAPYVEDLFRKVIAVMASILKLRKRYFVK